MYRQSEKKLVKWQYLLHMSSMVNFSPLTAEICWRVWDTQQISTGSRLCFDVVQRRSTKLCTMFGRLLHWYTVYALWAAVAP